MWKAIQNLLVGFLTKLAEVIYVRSLQFEGSFFPSSGASVSFSFDLELFGHTLKGSFTASVDFNNIAGSLATAAVNFVKGLITPLRKRGALDSGVDPTAITIAIGEACLTLASVLGEV